MIKFQPYEQYDVLAMENWLNEIAEQGYELTTFGPNFCKFKPNHGPRVYYRVRYIDANTDIKTSFWWGDLYVYHSTNPAELPRPNYEEDSKIAAGKQGKPYILVLNAYIVFSFVKDLLDNFAFHDILLSVATVLSLAMWSFHAVGFFTTWNRANHLASGSKTVITHPPKRYTKLLLNVGLLLAIATLLIALYALI